MNTKSSRGICRLFTVDDKTGRWSREPIAVATNSRMYTWGYLACQCLGLKNTSYAISGMYIEYANVADPSDAVTIPSFNLQDDITYYQGLALSSNRDYLRVPLVVTPTIGVGSGYEAYFPPGQGNLLTVFAQSAGSVGANGRPFSAEANSKVCGVALVALPVFNDPTQDVLFARAYYAVENQAVKSVNDQFGVQYSQLFADTD